MWKSDNDWEIETGDYDPNEREVTINGIQYSVDDKIACLTHAIMLLVDSVNDK